METQTDLPSTKDVIISMLKENTGKSFLDSGGAYGRHWEQNQYRNFEEEEEFTLEVWGDHISLTVNVFHFLIAFLEYNQEAHKLNQKFTEFSTSEEMERESWITCADSFLDVKPRWENTYNMETNLSQVLQYCFLDSEMLPVEEHYDVRYAFLQIHNGCDVRGGYTKPVLFEFTGDPDYWYMKMSDFTGSCQYHYHDSRSHRLSMSPEHNMPDVEYNEPEEDRTFDKENDRVICNHCVEIINELNKEEIGKSIDDLFNFDSDIPLNQRYEELVKKEHEVENTPHEEILEMAEIDFYWTSSY